MKWIGKVFMDHDLHLYNDSKDGNDFHLRFMKFFNEKEKS